MSGIAPNMNQLSQYDTLEDELNLAEQGGDGLDPLKPKKIVEGGMMIKNPALMAGMVGLKALEAYKQRKELERQERYQAQVNVTNRTQNALAQLSNIGKALKL